VTNPVLWTRALIPAWIPFAYAVFAAGLRQWPLLLIGLVLVALAWPRRVEIGAEGIRVRGLVRRRTIAYRTIRLAAPDGKKQLNLTVVGGETLTLRTGPFGGAFPAELLDRLWKAIAAGAEDGSRGVERDALARSGRSTAAWRIGLRELAKPSSYRHATVAPERLWTIAENPGIEPEVRAGAIVALAASKLEEGGRDRLRRIDATTVDPALHVLLEHAANDSGEPEARIIDAALDGLAS
jgi:hypothetical protein